MGRLFTIATLVFLVFGVNAANAEKILYNFSGVNPGDKWGCSVNSAGDVNLDGFNDVIVGGEITSSSPQVYAKVYSGKDGSVIYAFTSVPSDFHTNPPSPSYCVAVNTAGDVNADGYSDLITGLSFADDSSGVFVQTGKVQIFSGKDGSNLYTLYGNTNGDHLGFSVSGMGDFNGDGYDEFLAGAPNTNYGYVRLYSGINGMAIFDVSGAAFGLDPDTGFASAVSNAGDVNHDGFLDFIVGAPRQDVEVFPGVQASQAGKVYVLSGFGGFFMYELKGSNPDDFFGFSIGGAVDIDKDGYPDIIVGAPQLEFGAAFPGYVKVFSGNTGAQLFHFVGTTGEKYGTAVSLTGDINNDFFNDFIIGAPSYDLNASNKDAGKVQIRSGKTGGLLAEIKGTKGDLLGGAVSGAGDVNNDGLADVVMGANQNLVASKIGYAKVIMDPNVDLTGTVSLLSLSQGGVAVFTINAGAQFANKPYLLLGSISGSVPGFKVDQINYPLNLDNYLIYSYSNPNGVILQNAQGVLDSTGKDTVTFSVPIGSPQLFAGQVVKHAVGVKDSTNKYTAVSNSVSIGLVP